MPVITLLLLGASLAMAAPAASITHLSGMLIDHRPDGTERILAVNSEVESGDLLKTAKNTFARLRFTDGGEIVLRPGTEFKIEKYAFDENKPEEDSMLLSMIKGGLRAVTGVVGHRNKERYGLQAVNATIGIRGTHYGILLCQGDCDDVPTVSGQKPKDGLHVDVVTGSISVTNQGGTQNYNAGQFGYVESPNTPPVLVPPSEGVRVTMPSSISQNSSDGRSVNGQGDSSCQVGQ